jgi:hypothetical protein
MPCETMTVVTTFASESLFVIKFPAEAHPVSATEVSAAMAAIPGEGAFACEGRLTVGRVGTDWRGGGNRS